MAKRKSSTTLNETAFEEWKRNHVFQSPSRPENYFFESVEEFRKGREEARKAGGIIFCRLSPLSRAWATPYSFSKQPAFVLGAINFGQHLSLPEKLEFSSTVSSEMDASRTDVVFPATSKVVLTTAELEILRTSFPFIRRALSNLNDKVQQSGEDSRQEDFKICPDVSVTIKALGSKAAGSISVYRVVSDVTNSRALSNNYQLMSFAAEELETLFEVYYEDLLVSLEAKFSRTRAYGMESIDVDELMRSIAPKIAGLILSKAKAAALPLDGDREDVESELLSILRRLTVEELEATCLGLLKKPKKGSYSRNYFAYLLCKITTKQGAQNILAHVFPALSTDPQILELQEQERQLSQLIAEKNL